MASPTQITEALPETLPGDFVEWDEASKSEKPAQPDSSEPSAGAGVVANAATQAAELQRAAAPSRSLPRGAAGSISSHESTSDAAAPHPAKSLRPPSLFSRDMARQLQAAVPGKFRFSELRRSSAPGAATMNEFYQILLPSLPANPVEITKAAREKWPIIAVVSAAFVILLAAATIAVFSRSGASSAEPSAASAPVTGSQPPEAAAPTHAHSTMTVPGSATAATTAAEAMSRSDAAGSVEKDAGHLREQAPAMDHQLNTPARLQVKATLPEPPPLPPGGFATSDLHGLDNSNAIGAVFSHSKQPAVQFASQQAISPKEQITSQQVITVPSGVALGLLIEQRPPVYPLIAKAARVAGTVVLAATISKTGQVESLSAVSGPEMLRYSAVDAVRTWRFKPYMINGQQTAIKTTINLHYSIH